MPISPIRAAIFDLDGTLFDRSRSFNTFLRDQVSRLPHLFAGITVDSYVSAVESHDDNGYEARHKVFKAVALTCDLPSGAPGELVTDFESRFPDTCIPMRGMAETLAGLKSSGFRLGLITNGRVKIQTRKIDGLGLREFLDVLVISEAFGARKPAPEIFHFAVQSLGVSPSEALYVGDNPEADVAGANSAGMTSVWMRNSFFQPPSSPDVVIDELSDLLRFLQEKRRIISG